MPRKRKTHAFSLIEVLMAIALMCTMLALTLGPGRAMFMGKTYEPLQETLRRSIREARALAITKAEPLTLEWDSDAYCFIIRTTRGDELKRIVSEGGNVNDDILFERIKPVKSEQLPRSKDVDLEEIAKIRFDPNRGCTPFVATIHYAGEDSRVRYDSVSNLKLEVAD